MIELKVLFWNLGGNTRNKDYKPGIEAIKELTERDSFDVILLAECNEQARLNIYSELNKISSTYVNGSTIGSKLAVFHKLSQGQKPIQVFHSQRYSFFHYMDTLVVGVHLQSRYPNSNGVKLYKKAAEVKTEIVEIADKYSTKNIIIVGDFNLDPFEHGMTAMDGFNASFSPIVAKRRPILRLYAKKYLFKHPYFFNPSWHLHGHFGNRVQGTYYKTDSEYRVQFHMLDQVIVTKNFLPPVFNMDYFTIISGYTNLKGEQKELFNKNGAPNINYSDHFPIKFEVKKVTSK